jgi:hypothetical protein
MKRSLFAVSRSRSIACFDSLEPRRFLAASVANGGFQSGLASWAAQGSATTVNGAGQGGSTAAQLSRPSASDPRPALTQALAGWAVGETYQFGGFVNAQSATGSGTGGWIALEAADASGNWLGGSYIQTRPNLLTYSSKTFVVPANTASLTAVLTLDYNQLGTVIFDDIAVGLQASVKNGGFQSGLSSWTSQGSASTSNSAGVGGSIAAQLSRPSASDPRPSLSQALNGWAVGETYQFGGFVNAQSATGSGTGGWIALEASDASGNWLGGSYIQTRPNSLTYSSKIFVVPANTASLKVVLTLDYSQLGTVVFDDIAVRLQPSVMNGGFQSGLASWTSLGSATTVAGAGQGGTNAVQLSRPSASDPRPIVSQALNGWAVGETYQFGGFVNAQSATGAGSGAWIALEAADGAGNWLDGSYIQTRPDALTYSSKTFVVPANTISLKVVLTLDYNQLGTVSLDGIAVGLQGVDTNGTPRNPGFENPTSWWSGAGFSYAPTQGRDGSIGLRYERLSTTSPYATAGQSPLSVTPGTSYDISAWVSAESLSPSGSKVLAVESYNSAGNLVGAQYGTVAPSSSWQQVVISDYIVPTTATSTLVSVFLAQGATGKLVFDDVAVTRRTLQPWQSNLITPNQPRIPSNNGQIVVSSMTTATFPGVSSFRVRGRLFINNTLSRTATGSVSNERASLNFGTGLAQSSNARVDLQLENSADGTVLATDSFPIAVVSSAVAFPTTGVYVDNSGRTIVNNVPFYSTSVTHSFGFNPNSGFQTDIDNIKQSAFNTVLVYDACYLDKVTSGATGLPGILTALDSFQAAGLKVIFNLEPRAQNWSLGWVSGESNIITTIVNGVKTHPAILGWYIADEPQVDGSSVDQYRWDSSVAVRRALVNSLDTTHPTIMSTENFFGPDTYGDPRVSIVLRNRNADIVGVDPYPIIDSTSNSMEWIDIAMNNANRALKSSTGASVWIIPQAHNLGLYYPGTFRSPTEVEIRSMTLRGIQRGARGVLAYSYFDQQRDPTAPFSTRWPILKNAIAPLADLRPFLLNSSPSILSNSDSSGRVLVTRWVSGSLQRVIATSLGSGSTSASFTQTGLSSSWYSRSTISGSNVIFSGNNIDSDILS